MELGNVSVHKTIAKIALFQLMENVPLVRMVLFGVIHKINAFVIFLIVKLAAQLYMDNVVSV